MHDRLPFDQENVVRSRGAGILTRMKTPEDRALLRSFLSEQK